MAQVDIDLSNDQPLAPRDLLPDGTYPMMIVDSTVKPTKDGRGRYLEVALQVIDGEHKGRMVWDRVGLWYASEKAVEIARHTLRSITDAIGHSPVVKDSSTLHNKPLSVTVRKKQDEGYQPKNEVTGYAAPGSAVSAPPAAAAPTSRPAWAGAK